MVAQKLKELRQFIHAETFKKLEELGGSFVFNDPVNIVNDEDYNHPAKLLKVENDDEDVIYFIEWADNVVCECYIDEVTTDDAAYIYDMIGI